MSSSRAYLLLFDRVCGCPLGVCCLSSCNFILESVHPMMENIVSKTCLTQVLGKLFHFFVINEILTFEIKKSLSE